MNTILNKIAGFLPLGLRDSAVSLKLALLLGLLLAAGMAGAQPANDNFTNAWVITGQSGTTNGDNTFASLESCENNIVNSTEFGPEAITNTVWFAWTATATGTLEVNNAGSANVDFVLSVWTSTNTIPTICDGSLTNILADDGNGGISQLDFSVVAGKTYYISLSSYDDGTSPNDNVGPYVLNWNQSISQFSSGSFQLSSGNYLVSERDSQSPNVAYDGNTVDPSLLGARITITRPAPGYGRVLVDYSVTDPGYTNLIITNITATTITTTYKYQYYYNGQYYNYTPPDLVVTNNMGLPAGITIFTNVVPASTDFTLVTNTVSFDNYQLGQDVLLPLVQRGETISISNQTYHLPGMAVVTLSNPRPDPQEPSILAPPTLSLSLTSAIVNTASTTFPQPSGSLGLAYLNLVRSTFRVDKDVYSGNAVINVIRTGGKADQSISVDYIIDPTPGNGLTQYSPANTFPLQAGSDYATKNSDFTPVSGTLTWAAYDTTPKIISIPIINNSNVEQNEDFLVKLYFQPSEQHNNEQVGEVNQANVTILFDDTDGKQQPAGALDRTWNQNGVKYSNPPYLPYPGTAGGGGTVYAVAEQPDGKAIIAGSFTSFDSQLYNRIARVLNNGFQDTSFLASPNSGANDFISSLALQPNGKILIGGNFTSFNGSPRYHIARLNSDGSVDSTFNPGFGANGTVWCMILQTNGQVVIGGSFTSYNGTNVNKVARINADGSLDTTFNPGTGPNDTVNAVAVDSSGRVIIGGSFDSVAGVSNGGISRLNVDGSLDTTFTAGIGTYNPDSDSTDPVYAIAVQSDGKILIGGSFSFLDLINYNGLARLNSDGTIDLNFKPGTGTLNPVTGLADTIYSVLLQTNNEILIGGDLTTFNQTRRIGVARLFGDGTVDTSFMDSTYNQFAGLPNQYFNSQAVSTNYPYYNTRNAVYALAQEAGGNVIIGGIFPWVGGGYTYDDIRPRSNVARLVGGSTPGPGNIEFSYGSYSVNNSQGSLYVSLVRTNGNLGIVSATFTTNTDGTGAGIASGEDFSLNPIYSSPTWTTAWSQNAWMYDVGVTGPNYNTTPVNTTQADVYVGVTNSGNITGNLSANFKLSNPIGNFSLGGEYISLGAALGAQAAAPLTIIDTSIKPGVLGFSSPTYSVVQNRSVATITVTRTNGSDGIVTVWYAVSNGTATNGVDYTVTTPNQLTFAVGQTNATFTIPTKSATTIHPDKIVNLQLFSPAGGATLGLTNAILNLINGVYTYGHLEFSAANYTVNENGGAAVVTINRVGGSTGTLNVTMITADQTAIDGTNYIGISTNLQWNSGDASPRNITIPVLDDGVVTPNLVANLLLTNSFVNTTNNVGPLSFGNTNATLTINNLDSAGSVQFSTSSYSVKKYGGYALIPVIRTGGSIGTVTVGYTTIDGSAQSGSSYTTTAGTLTFSNGVVSQSFLVPITNNPAVTGLVSLTLQLSPPTGLATLGTPNVAVLNIIDGDSVDETPGLPDVTYGSAVNGFNAPVYCLALQTNNQLIVGGDFTLADGVYRQRIARLNDDGTLDSSFLLPSSTIGADNSVRAIAIQSDGRVLVGGKFTNMNSQVVNGIARLNYDGTLDSLFNVGSGADSPIYALAQTFVNGNAAILVGGSFAHLDGQPANCIGRLTGTGSPDPSFNTGSGANGTIYALAVQADGRVIIGGDFTAVNGVSVGHIARLNLDGSVDLTFTNGTANDSVRAIAIQLDGQILAGGLFTSVNGNTSYNHIVRLNSADGSPDSTFNPGLNIISPGPNNSVFSIAVQTDGRIVVGGTFTQANGVTRNRITRLNANGTTDPTINFGVGADSFVAAIAVEESTIASYPPNVPDEKIIIGGGFLNYFGAPHPYLARIYGGSEGGSGAFAFSSAYYGVNENGSNVVITVDRTGGTSGTNADGSGDIFVTFAATNGTAQPGVNYVSVLTNVDFPMGEVQETVAIPIIDDQVITSNLTVNLSLTPIAPATYGNQPTALLTITNVDSAISFQYANYQVNKYGSNVLNSFAPITVNRLGATYGTSTVVFSTTTNGTATPGVDYQAQTNVLVTFAPGIASQQVNIPIINGVSDGATTVGLQLTNVAGSALYSPSNAVLTILDQTLAKGYFTFSATNYSVSQGGGSGQTLATITVLRTNGASGIVSVSYNTTNGTALAGIQYVPTSGTLTFGDGVLSQSFTVPVFNTSVANVALNLSLLLSNPTGGAGFMNPSNATLTILNTNTGFYFAAATNTAPENTGFVTLTVMRNNTNGLAAVDYATADGTGTNAAVNGTNYVAQSGTLVFVSGQLSTNVVVPLIYDPLVTGDLEFTVGLTNANNAQIIAPTNAVVIDQDADAGLSFTNATTSVLKNGTNAVLAVVCSNPRVEPVTVSYFTLDGTATNQIDYTATSGTLIFSNGVTTNIITVPILNNQLLEGNVNFSVVLSNAIYPGQLLSPSTNVVTIIDSNPGVSFSSPVYAVSKTGVQALINVYRTGYTNSVMSVNYATANGTGTNGIDYVATSGTMVFTNGVTNQTFAVTVVNQLGVQLPKTVLLNLFNPSNAILVAPTNATLTILNNTNTQLAFALATNSVAENSGFAAITVTRYNNPVGTVSVAFGTTNGTALSGVNYTATNGTLVFTNGQMSQTIIVPLIYDPLVTGDLQFTVGLSSPGGAQLITPSVTTVIDQDADAGVSFTNATTSVLKNGTNAVLAVVCSNPRVEPVTVSYFTLDGTATNQIDYTATSGTLIFSNGVTTNIITVPILNNQLLEGNVNFSVVLTNAIYPGQLLLPETNVVTIIDSNPGISFSSSVYSADKASVQTLISVNRTGYTNSVMAVNFATANGTAASGIDYVATNGTLVFTNGVTNQTFAVTLINQLSVQPPKTVLLSLFNPSNAIMVAPTNATLTITDTNAGIAFASAGYSLIETTPFATINVLRYNNTSGTNTVYYSTTNGPAIAGISAAVAGVNYSAVVNQPLTFLPGVTNATIYVPLIYDTNVTGPLQFTVGLASSTPGVVVGTPGATTVVLQDADTALSFSTNASTVLKNAGSITLTVFCSNTNVEPVSVSYATTNDTATAGTDYTATSGTLTFSNGVSSQTFTVPISNNGLITGNRIFYVNLSNPTGTGRLLPGPSQESVTIIDSNSGLDFSSATYTVLKTNGPAIITVYRTDNTNNTTTVNYAATNGTAINGQNFTAVSGTLVFTNGATSQSFSVPIIPTAVVQPDLTVLLNLSAPVNGILLSPSAATLTIRDNSGSYVIPAGSQLVTNYTSLSNYTNDVIGSNDTVQVLFAFRDASAKNVNNLIATLLPTNGVASPNPSSQPYGPLTSYGHSVSEPFTFTAHGSNSQSIAATFLLQDGSTNIGTAVFGYTLGTASTMFSNNALIIINDDAAASPYPSVINVSGVGGSLLKATVTLNKFAHTDPHDVSALVVAPVGANTLVMSHAGNYGGYPATNLVLTFDDAATNSLPSSGAITNGTYKPTSYSPPNKFP